MKSFKFPSRNKKIIDESPLKLKCPICKHAFEPTEENTEIIFHTTTYWCPSCGEQIINGMKVYDYKYSRVTTKS